MFSQLFAEYEDEDIKCQVYLPFMIISYFMIPPTVQLFWEFLLKAQKVLVLFPPGAYLAVLPYGHGRRCSGGGRLGVAHPNLPLRLPILIMLSLPPSIHAHHIMKSETLIGWTYLASSASAVSESCKQIWQRGKSLAWWILNTPSSE